MRARNQNQAGVIRFGVFEVDAAARELRRRGVRVRLQEQPFRVLEALLERPGEVVTREELRQRLWARDEFVEFDASLNTAVQKIREALGDSAKSPRFLETVPKVGYRFIAAIDSVGSTTALEEDEPHPGGRLILAAAVGLAIAAAAWTMWPRDDPSPLDFRNYRQRQLTHDDGLTFQPTLSPDGKLIAYASDRDGQGNLDLYVQQVSGGSPSRITDDPADDYQPHFSPDVERIVFRSERGGGGVYTVRSVGSDAPRHLAVGGYNPRFSPDGSIVAFYRGYKLPEEQLYIVSAEGGDETRLARNLTGARLPVWTPDGSRLLLHGWGPDDGSNGDWYSSRLDGSDAIATGAAALAESLTPRLVGTSFHQGAGPAPIPAGSWPGALGVIFGARSGDDGRLWVQRFSADYTKAVGAPQPLTFGTVAPTDPTVSATGVIAFAELDIGRELLGLPVDEAGATPEVLIPDISSLANTLVSVSFDGTRVAYVSRKAGQLDVRVTDLASGTTIDATETPEEEDRGVALSPDGKRVAFMLGGAGGAVALGTATGGPVGTLCDACRGAVGGWSADSRKVVIEGPTLMLLDAASGEKTELFEDSLPLWHARMAPDGRWMAFIQPADADGERDFSVRRLFVAEIRGDALAPKDEWIPITDGNAAEGWGDWSADNNSLYYWLVRDEAKVIYRQMLDPSTKRPLGQREEIQRFTQFDERLYGQGMAPYLAASATRLVFPMLRLRSNIWIMEPTDAE